MDHDCVVVGASFAGLACAMALARAGLRVTVLEKKADAGDKLHTTGIIVKDAIDQVAILDRLPAELHAIADYLCGRREDPSTWFVSSYPRFRVKRLLRFAFDRFQSDVLFNLLLHTRLVRTAASIVYFHHKGVFDPHSEQAERAPIGLELSGGRGDADPGSAGDGA
jgi:2-polyprenyl-6-methoxyphenol hydroxylase-like FAD-dependent oxidoreductase